MPNHGVTEKGFKVKRLSDLTLEKKGRAVELFTDLVPPNDVVDTSDSSLLGRLIALSAPGESALWELAQMVYLSFDPNSATGVALDNLVMLAGIERFRESRSTVDLLLTGDVSTFIPEGVVVNSPATGEDWEVVLGGIFLDPSKAGGIGVSVVEARPNSQYNIIVTTGTTVQGVFYATTDNPTEESILSGLFNRIREQQPTWKVSIANRTLNIDATGMGEEGEWSVSSGMGITKVSKFATAMSYRTGGVAAEPNTITNIRTPILGLDSATNLAFAVLGRGRESDEELRLRFRNSKYQRAGNILESLYTALIGIPEVEEVKIYENDTDVVNEHGLPPHSFMPVILGGSDADIASNIWNNKPLGIASHGNTVVPLMDSQGFVHNIGFERPYPVPVFITVTITKFPNFPPNGEEQIRQALVDYFNTLNIGDDVIYSRLYTPINSVEGHQVDSLYVALTGNPVGNRNISIPFNRIAGVSPSDITIISREG